MKVFYFVTLLAIFISCIGSNIGEGFYIDHLSPQSTEFENTLKVAVHFSLPINKKRFDTRYIQLIEHNCSDCVAVPISSYSFNDEEDAITIESENVEPGKYYNIIFSGKIASQENLLLSYYYNGDYIADEIYYIKERRGQSPCITINEVLNYPSGSSGYEFIELFNCSDEEIDLRGFYIQIDDFEPQRLFFSNGAYLMQPSQYSIILSDIRLPTTSPTIYIQGKFGRHGLSNIDLKKVQILNESGMVISEFTPFARARRGVSFERINPYENSNYKNWGFSKAQEGSTPNKVNSIYLMDIFLPEIVSYETNETDIILKFNEQIVCESNNCIYLLTDNGKKISGISNANDNKIYFVPVRPIEYESKYKIITTSALKDINGNRYRDGETIGEIITPAAPSLRLYYPMTNTIPSPIKYLEIVSKAYLLDESDVYLKGSIQSLKLNCVKGNPTYHYLCTIVDELEGPEKVCLVVDDIQTDICINLSSIEVSVAPEINILLSTQIKDILYLKAESNLPCLLFADFSYKEDLDETTSFSTYSFSQAFEYSIKIQEPNKEYFVDIYCVDMFNQSSAVTRISTRPVLAKEGSLIITEVLPNPSGADTASEFIEIFNNGNSVVDLSRVSIGDCINSPIKISKYLQANLDPGSSALIVSNNSKYFSDLRGCIAISGANKIIGRDIKNSSPEMLCLYYEDYLVDIFNSDLVPDREDVSIERVEKAVYLDPLNWRFSDIQGGTPCK